MIFSNQIDYLADSKSLLAASKIPSSTDEVDFLIGGKSTETCFVSVSVNVDMLLLFLSSFMTSRILTFPALFSFEILRLRLLSEFLYVILLVLISFILLLFVFLIRFFSFVKFSLSSSAVLKFVASVFFGESVILYFLNQL